MGAAAAEPSRLRAENINLCVAHSQKAFIDSAQPIRAKTFAASVTVIMRVRGLAVEEMKPNLS